MIMVLEEHDKESPDVGTYRVENDNLEEEVEKLDDKNRNRYEMKI